MESNPAREILFKVRGKMEEPTAGGRLVGLDHGSMYQNIPRAPRLQGRDDFSRRGPLTGRICSMIAVAEDDGQGRTGGNR